MALCKPDTIFRAKPIHEVSHYIKGRILDLGCGPNCRYADLIPKYLRIGLDVDVTYTPDVVGKGENLPFKNDSFDSILCLQVLEHVSEPGAVLKEMWRVCRNNSNVLIMAPQFNELHEEPNDYFRYTCFGLKHLIKKQGFKVIEIKQRGAFFSLIAHASIRYAIDRFNLVEGKLLTRLLRIPVKFIVAIASLLDHFDQSKANRKHALGWTVIAKKSVSNHG